MSDIFISYSRKDIAYARLLHKALNENDFETWIDWQDIPPSTEWLQEVFSAIEEANTFIFILSSSSMLSEICIKEIEHANQNNKRIIPIVIDDVKPSKVHPTLAAINWIFSRTKDELQPAIESLIEAIQTDYNWVKAHTRLQVRALEWEREQYDKSFLLQGTDLQQAENWLTESVDKEPEPTLKQTRYIQSSRQEASKRQRRLLFSVGAALVVTVVLGVFAVINGQRATQTSHSLATQVVVAEEHKEIAEENARLARIRELTAVSQVEGIRFDLAMLLGVESFNSIENFQTKSNLLRLTQLNPSVNTIMNHEGVREVYFSPDGEYLISRSNDTKPIIWDTDSGKSIDEVSFLSEYDGISSLAFSPDGKTLAISGNDFIDLWNVEILESSKKIGEYPGDKIMNIVFSADRKHLAVGTYGGTGGHVGEVIILDTTSMQPISSPLRGYFSEGGKSLQFNPDGTILAYTTNDSKGTSNFSSIILWDVSRKQPVSEPLEGFENFIHDISFSPDGVFLVAVGEGSWIKIWDTASWESVAETNIGHISGLLSISFNPDGDTFATSSRDRNIILWDTTAVQPIGEPLSVHDGEIHDIAFSPDGKTLASCSLDNTIILWDMTDSEQVGEKIKWENANHWGLNNTAFSPDRTILALGYGDGSIILFDTISGQQLGDSLKAQEENITGVAYSQDGKILASASLDGTIVLWDAVNKQPINDPIITGDAGKELTIALSPDGSVLVSATHGSDNAFSLWNTVSGLLLDELEIRNNRINTLAFSPDGNILVIGPENGIPLFWDVVNKELSKGNTIPHTGWISSLAFSPDGEMMASGTDGSTIMLWDVASRQPLGDNLRVHNTPVMSITFNHDGTLMASVSQDGTIILWDTYNQQPLGDPLQKATTENRKHLVAFSQDGKTLLSFSEGGSISSWIIDPEAWKNQLCNKVGRNFTQEEWAFYFPGEAYRKTCEQWPEGG